MNEGKAKTRTLLAQQLMKGQFKQSLLNQLIFS